MTLGKGGCVLRPHHTFTVVPSLPEELNPLRELAFNLWWTWNPDAIALFRRLDDELWESTRHNPVLILGTIRQSKIEQALDDDAFLSHMRRVHQAFEAYVQSQETWFDHTYAPDFPDMRIGYFSMEFGITEGLPIYSGGLGVLSGDHLKSASDLGLPLVGVGLAYQRGYCRQYLNADGWQQESYPINDFYNMPMQMMRDDKDQPLTIGVAYPGREVRARLWRIQVGRVPLYLLDANIPENRPEDRQITSQLYGGDNDMRIRQELLLGVGGLRALQALGAPPSVCHMNEGHSAFLALERIHLLMEGEGLSYAEAAEVARAGNVFTTHTPVAAGIDLFPTGMMDHYLGEYYRRLGLSRDAFMRLGQSHNPSPDESFAMAVLAIRLANATNGVSRLHGQVAREMWHDLWPQTPAEEVPITSITNGIHPRSFISQDMAAVYSRYLGPRWVERPEDRRVWQLVDRIPDEELWRTHERRRERLVAVARARLREQLARHGGTPQEIGEADDVLDPEVLTIGFARRFATYKRALLLFTDPERLSRILNDPERPVQILFAGKAHPNDNPGKEFIRQLVHYTRREELRHRIVFLEDYDLELARYMVQGVDVWLNTPRSRMEASGTSGMKVAANGGLNLSTFDGWWCEGYAPDRGWSIGHGEVYADEAYGDRIEAEALYDLLAKDVAPLFYDRASRGSVPRNWIAHMKSAIREITPRFSAHRMVQEYCEELYLPAEARYRHLAADECAHGRALAQWMQHLRSHWGGIRFESIESDAHDGLTVETDIGVRANIHLSELTPDDVTVEISFGTIRPDGTINRSESAAMEGKATEREGVYAYEGTIRCGQSGLHGYSLRILPRHEDLSHPHIPGLVIWSP